LTGVIGMLSIGMLGCSQIPTPSNLMPAVIQGRVMQTVFGSTGKLTQQGVSGAELVVVKYDKNGVVHRVDAERVYTGDAGEFRLPVYTRGESQLVLRAVKGNERWQTIITEPLHPGMKIEIPPMNYQTTIAAKLVQSLPRETKITFEKVLEKIQTATGLYELPGENIVEELRQQFLRETRSPETQVVTPNPLPDQAQPVLEQQRKNPIVQVNSEFAISDSVRSYIRDLKKNSKPLNKPIRFMIQVKKDQEAVITREEVEGVTTATQHRLWSGLKTTMLQDVEMNTQEAFSGEFLLTIHPG